MGASLTISPRRVGHLMAVTASGRVVRPDGTAAVNVPVDVQARTVGGWQAVVATVTRCDGRVERDRRITAYPHATGAGSSRPGRAATCLSACPARGALRDRSPPCAATTSLRSSHGCQRSGQAAPHSPRDRHRGAARARWPVRPCRALLRRGALGALRRPALSLAAGPLQGADLGTRRPSQRSVALRLSVRPRDPVSNSARAVPTLCRT